MKYVICFIFWGTLNQDPVLSLRRDWTRDFWIVLALLDAIRTIQVGSSLHLEMDMNLQEAGAKYYYLIVKCPNRLMKPLFEKIVEPLGHEVSLGKGGH